MKEIGRESIGACSPVLIHYPFIFLKWWEWLEVKTQLRRAGLHIPNAGHLECATGMLVKTPLKHTSLSTIINDIKEWAAVNCNLF
jgi:hypothetical protein